MSKRLKVGVYQNGLRAMLDILISFKQLKTVITKIYDYPDKLKVEVQKSLDETQVLFDSLMQEYFEQQYILFYEELKYHEPNKLTMEQSF